MASNWLTKQLLDENAAEAETEDSSSCYWLNLSRWYSTYGEKLPSERLLKSER